MSERTFSLAVLSEISAAFRLSWGVAENPPKLEYDDSDGSITMLWHFDSKEAPVNAVYVVITPDGQTTLGKFGEVDEKLFNKLEELGASQ